MKNKISRKLLFSIFAIPLFATPIWLATTVDNKNTSSISLDSKDLNLTEAERNANLSNALAVSDTSIKSFADYIVSYEDKNITPVNVILPKISASEPNFNIREGGATVGMTSNKQTITFTAYDGLLLWDTKLTENLLLKEYYSSVKKITDISKFKVVNYAYLESKKTLFVLFGEDDGTTLKNLVVFGLNINSGSIVVPANANLASDQIIVSAKNDSQFIFFNSSEQLVVTSGNKVTYLINSTKVISFDENDSGFKVLKGNEQYFNYTQVAGTNPNDIFVGFLPSTKRGFNYSLWIGQTNSNIDPILINQSSNPTDRYETSGVQYKYYIVVVNDNFENVVNTFSDLSVNLRGYIAEFDDTAKKPKLPDFKNVYKRFFYNGSSDAGKDFLCILVDSFYPTYASFTHFSFDVDQKKAVLDNTQNNKNQTIDGPKTEDFGNNRVLASSWKFDSVSYDKSTNSIYYSISGQIEGSDRVLAKSSYVKLNNAPTSYEVRNDSYIQEDSPYTLVGVNLTTYADKQNAYISKLYINNGKASWLTRPTSNNSSSFTATTNSDIKFYSFDKVVNDLENSELIISKMPSMITNDDINNFIQSKYNIENATIDIKNITVNKNSNLITFISEITYSNNFGNGSTTNDKVIYTLYDSVRGFSENDLVVNFKDNAENSVVDIKNRYSAKEIVNSNNKGFVIQNLLKEARIKNINIVNKLDDKMITISNPDKDKKDLKVDITLSPRQNVSEFGLPLGFDKDLTKSFTFTGFEGTEIPAFVPLPSLQSANSITTLTTTVISLIAFGS